MSLSSENICFLVCKLKTVIPCRIFQGTGDVSRDKEAVWPTAGRQHTPFQCHSISSVLGSAASLMLILGNPTDVAQESQLVQAMGSNGYLLMSDL